MPDPIKWKSKIILSKIEPANAYGADAGPTGAANAMLLTDVSFSPMEGEDVSRNIELPWQGAQEELGTAFRAVLTGSFELVGSGTPGVPPAWGPLLRSCGAAEVVTPDTSVEYKVAHSASCAATMPPPCPRSTGSRRSWRRRAAKSIG